MKKMKKIISILLVMVLLLGVMPVISFSAESTPIELNTTYELNIDGEDLAYTFTPSDSGYYRLISCGYDDPYVYCYDSSDGLVAEADDCYDSYNFNCVAYLSEDETYTYYVGAYDETEYAYICLEKLDVYSSTVMTEGESYTVELEDETSAPALFEFVPEEDGYYGFKANGSSDSYGYLYDSDMCLLYDIDDTNDTDFYLDWYLFADETYYLEAGRYDILESDSYKVSVAKTDVIEEIEITELPNDISVIDGLIDETIDYSGLVLNLTYSNGEVVEWHYDTDDIPQNSNLRYGWYYDDDMNPYVEIYSTFGYDYYFLKVEEMNVDSISIVDAPEIVLYQDYDGYYNEESDCYYYTYSIPYGLQIKVDYADGTSEVLYFYESMFESYDEQYYNPWEIGENNIYITYFGAETTLPVQVKEFPIDSIELNNPPTTKFIKGDNYYGYKESEEEYWLYPYNFRGISFTVNYIDGTSKTYTNDDIDYDTMTVDGLSLYVDPVYVTDPGEYYVYLYVLDIPVEYKVDVLPESLLGDVDYDDVISVMDSTALQRYSAKLQTLTDAQICIGDVDKDGVISIMDATRIQMYIAKLITDSEFFYYIEMGA